MTNRLLQDHRRRLQGNVNIAAHAKDLSVSKPAADGGSKVYAFYCDPKTVERQGAAILAPPLGSDGP